MMPDNDSSPSSERAVLRTLARVVAVRGRIAAERGVRPDWRTDASLRLACEVAQRSGLHAEQLVLMVKESWRSLASPRERVEFDLALTHLVSGCISEFYDEHEAPRPMSAVPNADGRLNEADGTPRRRRNDRPGARD